MKKNPREINLTKPTIDRIALGILVVAILGGVAYCAVLYPLETALSALGVVVFVAFIWVLGRVAFTETWGQD